MSAEALCLAGDTALLALSIAAAVVSTTSYGRTLVYGGTLILTALVLLLLAPLAYVRTGVLQLLIFLWLPFYMFTNSRNTDGVRSWNSTGV